MACTSLPRALRGVATALALAGCADPGGSGGDPYESPVTDDPDAAVVLVFPARSEEELAAQWAAVRPWIEARAAGGLSFAAVPLYAVAGGDPTAAELRDHLAATFSDARSSATERGRYLGLLGRAAAESDPEATLPPIPRFYLEIGLYSPFIETDMPYGDPLADVDLSDSASTRFGDFEVADPTFLVFRVPAARAEDLARFSERAVAFDAAAYRADALLVAGTISLYGDTSLIQCTVEDALAAQGASGQVLKAFDADVCEPDLVLTADGDRLPDFLASADAWRGGFVYNISHGSGEGIYFGDSNGALYENLTVEDADDLPEDKLNVFLSLACDMDADMGESWNLNRVLFERGSVATVTATVPTYYDPGMTDVIAVETDALPAILGGGGTLLQGIGQVRASYYAAGEGYDADEQIYPWSNLLSLNVTGDGLLRVEN